MKRLFSSLILWSLILLILMGAVIALEWRFPQLHIVRMILGSVVVLLLPGYWITRWTFPLTGRENLIDSTDETLESKDDTESDTIDGLERFVLSVALSISAVPLVLFYVNFLWVPLSVWSVYCTICWVTLASIGGTIFIDRRHALKSK